ncbi:hypothetical protein ADUPG1_012620 [Aduncisulcus paluster]|uniref:MORN repeat-containing protein n=1 Tax=Aduncisulcus paluster TaxID=2918883 RepID=A0ABQ5K026_9EUKA|nr:hypothetical protein ADUPG1_012620 [Aduncisulcus paluster]
MKIVKYINGNRYSGSIFKGMMHGEGQYTWKDGSVYEGTFKDGYMHGYGRKKWIDGHIYEGFWHKDRQSGDGTLQYPDGTIYRGKWQSGLPHGTGERTYSNGCGYYGEFIDGHEHGTGRFVSPHGWSYEGSFFNGYFSGKGTLRYGNGRVYSGSWNRSVYEGYGRLTLDNGSVFEGDFFNGQPHGYGIHLTEHGCVYIGMFEQGQYHGKGKYIWESGIEYEGEWEHSNIHGKGTIRYPMFEGSAVEEVKKDFLSTTTNLTSSTLASLSQLLSSVRSSLTITCRFDHGKIDGQIVKRYYSRPIDTSDHTEEEHSMETQPQTTGGATDGMATVGIGQPSSSSSSSSSSPSSFLQYTGESLGGIPDGVGTVSWDNGREYNGEIHQGKITGSGEMHFIANVIVNMPPSKWAQVELAKYQYQMKKHIAQQRKTSRSLSASSRTIRMPRLNYTMPVKPVMSSSSARSSQSSSLRIPMPPTTPKRTLSASYSRKRKTTPRSNSSRPPPTSKDSSSFVISGSSQSFSKESMQPSSITRLLMHEKTSSASLSSLSSTLHALLVTLAEPHTKTVPLECRYVGTFLDGRFHGAGTLHVGQSIYKGEWSLGMYHGKGLWMCVDGGLGGEEVKGCEEQVVHGGTAGKKSIRVVLVKLKKKKEKKKKPSRGKGVILPVRQSISAHRTFDISNMTHMAASQSHVAQFSSLPAGGHVASPPRSFSPHSPLYSHASSSFMGPSGSVISSPSVRQSSSTHGFHHSIPASASAALSVNSFSSPHFYSPSALAHFLGSPQVTGASGGSSMSAIPSDLLAKFQCVYEGEFVEGLASGIGTLTWPKDGRDINGQFVAGDVEGKATFNRYRSNIHACSYTGMWRLSRPSGSGIYEWPNLKIVYNGEFKGGKFWGRGRLERPGFEYVGEFRYGKQHGDGVLKSQDITLAGQWREGDIVDYVDDCGVIALSKGVGDGGMLSLGKLVQEDEEERKRRAAAAIKKEADEKMKREIEEEREKNARKKDEKHDGKSGDVSDFDDFFEFDELGDGDEPYGIRQADSLGLFDD